MFQSLNQVHGFGIVPVNLLDTLLRSEAGEYQAQLRSGAGLKVSRYRGEELEQRIGKLQ